MLEIKNGGLEEYGVEPFDRQQFGTAGVNGVNDVSTVATDASNAAVDYVLLHWNVYTTAVMTA